MLLKRLRAGTPLFPEIDGRQETKADVIRTLLSGHNPYLISEEGTGKTRLARALSNLLPPVPVIKGCAYNDDPKWPKELLCPRCRQSKDPAAEYGIEFVPGSKRFSRIQGNEYTNEAKLLGMKDIQSIAQGGSLSDPRSFTGTGVFRANRGVLFIDELPVIRTKVQVLLHPILDEKKAVLEEYNWEQPLDLIVIATGNPKGFSHVNDIPRPLLDRLESIYMDLPEESIEKQIMFKERFTGSLKTVSPVLDEGSWLSMEELQRDVVIPWWVSDLITKSVRYSRICPHLESRPSVRATVRALDHTCASVEMENKTVAGIRHAYYGLRLALRGRMEITPDLRDFDNPQGDFALRDRLVNDFMWNVFEDFHQDYKFTTNYDQPKLHAELVSLLTANEKEIKTGRLPAQFLHQFEEVDKAVAFMLDTEHNTGTSEKTMYNGVPASIREELNFSAIEVLINILKHHGGLRFPEKTGVFLCSKL